MKDLNMSNRKLPIFPDYQLSHVDNIIDIGSHVRVEYNGKWYLVIIRVSREYPSTADVWREKYETLELFYREGYRLYHLCDGEKMLELVDGKYAKAFDLDDEQISEKVRLKKEYEQKFY